MTDNFFPTGKFTYTVGEYSPIVDISGEGKMSMSLDREVLVVSKYQVTGDVLEVEDTEGSYAGPEFGVGKYRWKYSEGTLTFSLIEDKMSSRSKAFGVPWYEVDRSDMPYYMEGTS